MKLSKGFTLIELIVVMAVFLFIIGAAIGIFLSIISNQKRVLAEQQILNQISYVEEYMSKALRMAKTEVDENCLIDAQGTDHPGYIYLLTRYNQIIDSQTFFSGIKFLNQSANDSSGNPACQEFFLEGGVLKERKNNGDAVALTPIDLQINFIKFSINGSNGSTSTSYPDICHGHPPTDCGAASQAKGDVVQPRVTMLLNFSIPGESASETIQTTVSRRNLNVQ